MGAPCRLATAAAAATDAAIRAALVRFFVFIVFRIVSPHISLLGKLFNRSRRRFYSRCKHGNKSKITTDAPGPL